MGSRARILASGLLQDLERHSRYDHLTEAADLPGVRHEGRDAQDPPGARTRPQGAARSSSTRSRLGHVAPAREALALHRGLALLAEEDVFLGAEVDALEAESIQPPADLVAGIAGSAIRCLIAMSKDAHEIRPAELDEIGRASCRERV